jgi:protein ImuB
MGRPRMRSQGKSDTSGSKRKILYACLHVQEFPLQALLRLRPELRSGLQQQAIAVLEGEPPFEHVCSMNDRALELGIVRGMTRIELELFPEAIVLTRSYAEEFSAKAALLECASRFSPRIEDQCSDGSFTVVLDIAGTEKLLGTPKQLGEKLMESVRVLGIRGCIAMSGNFDAAMCLARGMANSEACSDILIVDPGTEISALAPLPISVLGPSLENAESFSETFASTFSSWGIATLGELANLPETDLISRLGQQGKHLRQLARGESPHLFTPIEPIFSLKEQLELDSPVEVFTSLLFILATMLDQLIARAQSNLIALASLTLDCMLEGGAKHSLTVQPALPSNDRQLWLKLLDLDLQAHPPQAAVLSLCLSAYPGSTSKVQLGLFCPQTPEPMRLDVTLRRIRAIVGEDGVGRAVLKDAHRPDAFLLEPFVVPSIASSTSTLATGAASERPRIALRQVRPPEEIQVCVRNHTPESFLFQEKRYTVERAYGPWFSGGDWWNEMFWSVAQWDLVARAEEGSLLCCCLTHDLQDRCWRMEALYD